MILTFLILLSFYYAPCDSNDADLLKKSNEAVIDVLGGDIFTKYVKIDTSLTKFYMEDNSYDNLENYNKSKNYNHASIEYTLYEDGDMIGYFDVDSNKDTTHITSSGSLEAFRLYFEDSAFIRLSELKKIFKKLFPKEELFFRPYRCPPHTNDDDCNYLRISNGLIWETRFSSPPLSRGEYKWDYIRYNIFIDAKDPYNHIIVSQHNMYMID